MGQRTRENLCMLLEKPTGNFGYVYQQYMTNSVLTAFFFMTILFAAILHFIRRQTNINLYSVWHAFVNPMLRTSSELQLCEERRLRLMGNTLAYDNPAWQTERAMLGINNQTLEKMQLQRLQDRLRTIETFERDYSQGKFDHHQQPHHVQEDGVQCRQQLKVHPLDKNLLRKQNQDIEEINQKSEDTENKDVPLKLQARQHQEQQDQIQITNTHEQKNEETSKQQHLINIIERLWRQDNQGGNNVKKLQQEQGTKVKQRQAEELEQAFSLFQQERSRQQERQREVQELLVQRVNQLLKLGQEGQTVFQQQKQILVEQYQYLASLQGQSWNPDHHLKIAQQQQRLREMEQEFQKLQNEQQQEQQLVLQQVIELLQQQGQGQELFQHQQQLLQQQHELLQQQQHQLQQKRTTKSVEKEEPNPLQKQVHELRQTFHLLQVQQELQRQLLEQHEQIQQQFQQQQQMLHQRHQEMEQTQQQLQQHQQEMDQQQQLLQHHHQELEQQQQLLHEEQLKLQELKEQLSQEQQQGIDERQHILQHQQEELNQRQKFLQQQQEEMEHQQQLLQQEMEEEQKLWCDKIHRQQQLSLRSGVRSLSVIRPQCHRQLSEISSSTSLEDHCRALNQKLSNMEMITMTLRKELDTIKKERDECSQKFAEWQTVKENVPYQPEVQLFNDEFQIDIDKAMKKLESKQCGEITLMFDKEQLSQQLLSTNKELAKFKSLFDDLMDNRHRQYPPMYERKNHGEQYCGPPGPSKSTVGTQTNISNKPTPGLSIDTQTDIDVTTSFRRDKLKSVGTQSVEAWNDSPKCSANNSRNSNNECLRHSVASRISKITEEILRRSIATQERKNSREYLRSTVGAHELSDSLRHFSFNGSVLPD